MDRASLRILIVDDEPGMRKAASRALKSYCFIDKDSESEVCFETEQAADAKEAYALLESREYDLLLLDYKLPDASGLDILGHIREKKYDLLAIMMTAYSSIEVAISATKNGAFDFLAKPFSLDELRSVLQKAAKSLLLLRHARRLAEEKKQVRFQFLSVLSHELKAPLNAIEGYLNILDQKVAGNDIGSYEDMISRSLMRIRGMRGLIMDLLDLTRIESGQKVRSLKEVDVAEIAGQSVETMLSAAAERKIAIEVHSPTGIKINGDPGEIEIVFNNLISNAVKYNRDGGRVEVSLEKENDIVTIKVADTGIGMTKAEKEKLFSEFVRIKNDKTRRIEGNGLGLSILKRVTSLYDGDISVESESDKGSVFTVRLKDIPSPQDSEGESEED